MMLYHVTIAICQRTQRLAIQADECERVGEYHVFSQDGIWVARIPSEIVVEVEIK